MAVDIISNVLKAADNKLQKLAQRKLASAEAPSASVLEKAGEAFQKAATKQAARLPKIDLVTQVMGAADPGQREIAVEKLGSNVVAGADRGEEAAKQKLEGQLMASLIETMLPKNDGGLYGDGTAGDVWRGFHAQQMGEVVAEQDGSMLGLTDQIPTRRPLNGIFSSGGQWPYFQSRIITPYAG